MNRVGTAVVFALLALPPVLLDAQQDTHAVTRSIHPSPEFDKRDRRARTLITYTGCLNRLAGFVRKGTLSADYTVNSFIFCAHTDGVLRGVMGRTNDSRGRLENLALLDVTDGIVLSVPTDTTRLLALVRATLRTKDLARPRYQDTGVEFLAIPLRFDGDTVEVWTIPSSLLSRAPQTGGTIGYRFSPATGVLVETVDELLPSLAVQIEIDGAPVTIESAEVLLPTQAEVFLANLLHLRGKAVRIVTGRLESDIAGSGSNTVWTHTLKR